MATKLFLRNTQTNGIGSTYFDMVTTAGAGSTTAAVTTTASGTEIQWTQSAGGGELLFVSGRAPVGGFTLTTTDISIWAHESGTSVNAGGGYRLFKRAANGTETELAPATCYEDGVEFTKSTPTEMTWAGNPTDTAFAENDRILLKLKAVDVGTMGSGTATLTYNAADAATGDSFLNIAETVTFKGEEAALSGAISPSFTTTAILKGSATLSGATAPTFTTAGNMAAVSTLSGAISPSFTTAGAITGAAALSGSTAPAVTTSGTLNGDAALSGTIAPAFTTAGILGGSAALSGATAPIFTTAGILGGTASLSGPVAVAFAAAGDLTAGLDPDAPLSGTATLTFSPTGALDIEGESATPIEVSWPGTWAKKKKKQRGPDLGLIRELIRQRDEAIAEWKKQNEPGETPPPVVVVIPRGLDQKTRLAIIKLLKRHNMQPADGADDDDDEIVLFLAA